MHHAHAHPHPHAADANLKFAFFLNLFFSVVELIGGLWTNSAAITANALHDFGDSFALGISWYFEKLAHRGRDAQFSYGYRRFSPLGALIHALVLAGGAALVLTTTLPRLVHPQPVKVSGMIAFAVVGVSVNLLAALRLRRGRSLNEAVASWHLIEDVASWAAVLVVGAVLGVLDWPVLDPLLSLAILVWVMWNVTRRLLQTLGVFLQAVPSELKLNQIEVEIRLLERVKDVHHLHLWSLDGESHILTTHVVVPPDTSRQDAALLKGRIKTRLREFAILDATIEIEYENEVCQDSPLKS